MFSVMAQICLLFKEINEDDFLQHDVNSLHLCCTIKRLLLLVVSSLISLNVRTVAPKTFDY